MYVDPILELPFGADSVACLPSGQIAFTHWSEMGAKGIGLLSVIDRDGTNRRTLRQGVFGNLVASPVNNQVAFTLTSVVAILDLESNQAVTFPITTNAEPFDRRIAWSPDGEKLATLSVQPVANPKRNPKKPTVRSTLHLLLREGRIVSTLTGTNTFTDLSWNRNSDRVAYGHAETKSTHFYGGKTARLPLDQTTLYTYRPNTLGYAYMHQDDPDLSSLFLAAPYANLNVEIGTFSHKVKGLPYRPPTHLIWSPDAQHLLFNGFARGRDGWHLYNVVSRYFHWLFPEDTCLGHPVWSSDSRELTMATLSGVSIAHL